MNNRAPIRFLLVSLFLATVIPAFAESERSPQLSATPAPKDENSRDLFSIESVYTLSSDFRNESRLGDGDSFYTDFSYDHRFLITGKWYFRAGVEYERYDFGGTEQRNAGPFASGLRTRGA